MFSGFPIGQVSGMTLSETGQVKIEVRIKEKEARWLRTSSTFVLEKQFFGGAKIRVVSPRMADPPLPADAERALVATDATKDIPQVIARANKGGRFARFVLFTSRAEPGKITDVFVLAARDPARVRAEAWPTKAVSDRALPREIGARVQALADEDLFSGAVLVARGDRVLFRKAYGQAEAAFGIANKPDTAFNVASMGKMFTAVAIVRLTG